ncbi:MAG: SAF domain-containing protein, partial [Actinomycetota bacterium]|nr:SAF domain-containing protein [Actinomycetota bacterium]
MSGRRRAVIFTVLAALAAVVAMSLVSGYSSSVVESYGTMKAVVVVTRPVAAGTKITARSLPSNFETRRVPVLFSPAGSISDAAQAV